MILAKNMEKNASGIQWMEWNGIQWIKPMEFLEGLILSEIL